MHVTPTELRVVRRGSLVLRFSVMGPVATVLAELPATGSLETTLEELCTEPHWGVVLRGEIEVNEASGTRRFESGSGFYVPGGEPGHRFHALRRAVLAGFVPLDGRDPEEAFSGPPVDVDEAAIDAEARVQPPADGVPASPGEVRATMKEMGPWLLTQATFGTTSGYGTGYCDAPHWGVVIAGGATIEYEDDVEVLGAGDFYHTAGGPPGHRIEVPDRAVIADFTPLDALHPSIRLAEWRASIWPRARIHGV